MQTEITQHDPRHPNYQLGINKGAAMRSEPSAIVPVKLNEALTLAADVLTGLRAATRRIDGPSPSPETSGLRAVSSCVVGQVDELLQDLRAIDEQVQILNNLV